MQNTDIHINISPPPTDEELETLVAQYANTFMPSEQIDEFRLKALIRLRAERSKDA